jgi:hypothetical protein
MPFALVRSAAGLALTAGCSTAVTAHSAAPKPTATPPAATPAAPPATMPAQPANPIPQGNGGDQDGDNNGGPSDGDGNI